jgi:hypothetical protein
MSVRFQRGASYLRRMKCTSSREFELRLLGETLIPSNIGARNSPSGWFSLSAFAQKPVGCAPTSDGQ